MCSECINSASDSKSVTGNGFNDIGFLLWRRHLAIRSSDAAFCLFWRFLLLVGSFYHTKTSRSKFNALFTFGAAIFSHRNGARHRFQRLLLKFCDDNLSACAVSARVLLPVVNLSPEMDSRKPIFTVHIRPGPDMAGYEHLAGFRSGPGPGPDMISGATLNYSPCTKCNWWSLLCL